MVNKKITINDLAVMVKQGFDGQTKEFGKLNKRIDKVEKKWARWSKKWIPWSKATKK